VLQMFSSTKRSYYGIYRLSIDILGINKTATQ
jgi:hypothetical protein